MPFLFLASLSFLCFGFSGSGVFPKPLTKEEEERWIQLLENGTLDEKKAAKEKLILHNLRLVAHITKKFNLATKDTEELISIGTVGLMKAVDGFDSSKNVRLVSYAAKCIQNELLMWLRNTKKSQNDISLQEPIGSDRDGNEIVMLDIITSNTPDFADALDFNIQSKKMLLAIQKVLTKREQTVIVLRYGLGTYDRLTQQEIADILGISRSFVSRIEKKSLKKLRDSLSN
ncbi:RNA polymerase sporulation sigma factor SigK [Chakrabartyella piscis]|uniref:RNA polymerase sporulation sigma factor SigK n=1 Tax=Chakrabartyella piscis TaxID=2918914 RepID=UPI002958C034|nr:RNA polymerase sporulation sigma factor SigK [Chakrabartyella piscis]